jgi:hypothetical protein
MPAHGMTMAALEFREVMQGGFARGVSDPVAGARQGRRAGSSLTMHVSAAIADVPGFVRDPEHRGRLAGSITFPALGVHDAPSHGVFQLFAPSSDPDLKLMVYRVTFRAEGREYCLDGSKHVRRRSVLHAWTDTTTLFCRLHEGADTTGPVTAAGVLRLAPLAFARQLASFRTPGARGASDALGALAAFFAFFSGQVVDAYLVPTRSRVRSGA